MALALDQFVKQLADSGIIAPGKLKEFIPPNAQPKDAQELAQLLVQQKQLTKYQAQEIYQGRSRSLILGNYTILEKIGAGGMGQVFKAEHRRMKRVVAIKMLPPAVSGDPATVARFQREVEAAARLRHTNVVAADDADEANGAYFLVMEFVDGSDLSAVVKKNGPLTTPQALDYTLQAARGLAYAHAAGVVHRDIKPANLLLARDGTVKILDMGLARVSSSGDVSSRAELTGVGAIMGTIDYMAPEQAMNTKDADARADIYSLGCSLHYLLTGKPLYGGETLTARLMAHQAYPIPPLRAQRSDVSDELEAVFRKLVAKQPEERYQTMGEVVAALEQCVAPRAGALETPALASGADDELLTFLRDIPAATHKPAGKTGHKSAAKGARAQGVGPLAWGAGGAAIVSMALVAGLAYKMLGRGETPAPAEPGANGASALTATTASQSTPANASVAKAPPEDADAPASLIAPFDLQAAHDGQAAWAKHLGTLVKQQNLNGMTLILIPPGEFLMGSTPQEIAAARKLVEESKSKPDPSMLARLDDEGPQHRVMITRPFLLGATEVTIEQFKRFVNATGYVTDAERFGFGDSQSTKLDSAVRPEQKNRSWRTPGYETSDDMPVVEVTWNDAARFCNWLSDQERRQPCFQADGKGRWVPTPRPAGASRSPGAENWGYRLPTEAEWEYACRAGTTTRYSFGDDPALLGAYCWAGGNADRSPRPVGTKVANPFGLFDMQGSVWEACLDDYSASFYADAPLRDPLKLTTGDTQVSRGGGWAGAGYLYCRSSYRNRISNVYRFSTNGFRVARPL